LLEACHKAFYRPGNMLLCVVGDVDPEQVTALAQKILPKNDTVQVSRVQDWPEEMAANTALTEDRMEVSMPMFYLGFKCEPLANGDEAVRGETIGDLAAEALFGESSPLYLRLYEEGLIDTSFGGGFDTLDGMAMLTASGDSEDPQTVRSAILEEAQRLLRDGIPEEDFLRMKRSALGRRIRDLDSFDSTCFRLCAYHLSQFDYFRFPGIYQSIQVQEVLEFLQRVVTEARCSLSIIYPLETQE
jgi:predicted Zn-dependent peptidase